jgi:hypothetical protein
MTSTSPPGVTTSSTILVTEEMMLKFLRNENQTRKENSMRTQQETRRWEKGR